jgi:cytochrome c biogenesis protein CcmG/thiol:disulfide interchange protein DsbE
MNRRAQWMAVAGIIVAAVGALTIGARAFGDQLPSAVEAGAKAPTFAAVPVAIGADRRPRGIADYKGQVVLLNIWATWCDPCRAEMPSLQRLQDILGPQGLRIVAVSVDQPGMEQPIRDFAKEFGLSFEILYDPQQAIQLQYLTSGVPETFVIGRDGVIRKRVSGGTDWSAEQHQALIRQLLAEPAS